MADPNHTGEPGKGKIGRVNASKLPMRLRNFGSPVRWLRKAMSGPKVDSTSELVRARTPRPRSRGSTHPDRVSLVRNAAIPLWSGRKLGKPSDLRKRGPIPQRGHEGSRSECRQPKGKGNP